MKARTMVRLPVLLAIAAMTLGIGLARDAQAAPAQQIVFSGDAASGTSAGNFGYWVWCEASTGSLYGAVCSGSIVFLTPGYHPNVFGHLSESGGSYTASVSSSDISCTLTVKTPLRSGPNNTVTISCTKPTPFTTISADGVVNLTGTR